MLLILAILVPIALAGSCLLQNEEQKKKESRCLKWFKGVFIWSFLIRVQQFGYVYFVIVAMHAQTQRQEAVINRIVSFILFLVILIYPVNIAAFFATCSPADLASRRTKLQFGALYSNLDIYAGHLDETK